MIHRPFLHWHYDHPDGPGLNVGLVVGMTLQQCCLDALADRCTCPDIDVSTYTYDPDCPTHGTTGG